MWLGDEIVDPVTSKLARGSPPYVFSRLLLNNQAIYANAS